MIRLLPAAAILLACVTAAGRASAQTLSQDHTYTRAEVEAGQRLYGPQCQVCHGATGDGVPGIDLRLGRFRRAVSDEDLARVITTGVAGTGMPGFKLQPAELTGIVAFIRAGFDAASAA
ncbi:MAG TPA: cytochrome c, partial [Vicinamibacterales bacterium]